MDYWAETMQDDCYLIAGDDWKKAAQPQLIVEDKGTKTKTKPDFALGKKKYAADLIPPAPSSPATTPRSRPTIEEP